MRQSPWKLVLFVGVGIIGLNLVGFAGWMLALSIQNKQALAAPVSQNLFASSNKNGMIVITATLDVANTLKPTSTIDHSTPVAGDIAAPLGSTPTPLTPWNACDGAYPSRLRVGNRASVSLDPPFPNNVREQADKTSKFLFTIQPGDLMDIIGGPGCSGGWVWWQIRAVSGKTGWTSEGDGKDYWLVPID
jgi:hypothetical protein